MTSLLEFCFDLNIWCDAMWRWEDIVIKSTLIIICSIFLLLIGLQPWNCLLWCIMMGQEADAITQAKEAAQGASTPEEVTPVWLRWRHDRWIPRFLLTAGVAVFENVGGVGSCTQSVLYIMYIIWHFCMYILYIYTHYYYIWSCDNRDSHALEHILGFKADTTAPLPCVQIRPYQFLVEANGEVHRISCPR